MNRSDHCHLQTRCGPWNIGKRLVVVNGDPLFVLSGHGMFGQMPGYVLLVYGLKTGK